MRIGFIWGLRRLMTMILRRRMSLCGVAQMSAHSHTNERQLIILISGCSLRITPLLYSTCYRQQVSHRCLIYQFGLILMASSEKTNETKCHLATQNEGGVPCRSGWRATLRSTRSTAFIFAIIILLVNLYRLQTYLIQQPEDSISISHILRNHVHPPKVQYGKCNSMVDSTEWWFEHNNVGDKRVILTSE
jgi:hypothetical protein